MGYASYGNNSQQDSKAPEKPDPKAAGQTPEKGRDRPGFDLGGAKDRGGQAAKDLPAAGPHDKPGLTTDENTPGTGTLPDAGARDATDSTSG